uniref:Uncharacterized protein n=1 Tax=Strongyloides stercoralis TaxID=6248 RepID=A0A0K0ENP6_STRER
MKVSLFILIAFFINIVKSNINHNIPKTIIKGKFMCKGVPENNVGFAIVRKRFFGNYNLLFFQSTGNKGLVYAELKRNKLIRKKTFVKITHQCKMYRKNCLIEAFKEIPFNYCASRRNVRTSVLDLGTIDLIRYMPGQRTYCQTSWRKKYIRTQ